MKIIAIVGPTATGKSALAVKIAKKIEGEIISADSRAVYQGLDIGADKVAGRWKTVRIRGKNEQYFVYKGVRHYCIDFINPRTPYSAVDFVRDATAAAAAITARKKSPILCGGTGFWIDALTRPGLLSGVRPRPKLRGRLEKKSISLLAGLLKQLDPGRFETIDLKNKRRLIRALEIAATNPKIRLPAHYGLPATEHKILYLGLDLPNAELKTKIARRFTKQLRSGLIPETRKLVTMVSRKRLAEIGLYYSIVSKFIKRKMSKVEMARFGINAACRYAKRQKAWFKRNKKIHWLKDAVQANRLIKKIL